MKIGTDNPALVAVILAAVASEWEISVKDLCDNTDLNNDLPRNVATYFLKENDLKLKAIRKALGLTYDGAVYNAIKVVRAALGDGSLLQEKLDRIQAEIVTNQLAPPETLASTRPPIQPATVTQPENVMALFVYVAWRLGTPIPKIAKILDLNEDNIYRGIGVTTVRIEDGDSTTQTAVDQLTKLFAHKT